MTDDWVKPSAAGMAALRAERDAARAQIAAALAICDAVPTPQPPDYNGVGEEALAAEIRRALTGETP